MTPLKHKIHWLILSLSALSSPINQGWSVGPVAGITHLPRAMSVECEANLGVLNLNTIPVPVAVEQLKTPWPDFESTADFFNAYYKPEDLYTDSELESVSRFGKVAPWLDKGLVIVTAPVWLPLMSLAALITKIDSPGPVLFIQERVGKNGKPFRIYKLRTMTGEKSEDGVFTHTNDARITRFGKFARRWKIDELFQLLNVLKGDMSLVGPRPIVTPEFKKRAEENALYPYRLFLKPGLTGWGQVHLRYSVEEQRYYQPLDRELYEVKNLNFAMYAKTLLKTIVTVLKGDVSD